MEKTDTTEEALVRLRKKIDLNKARNRGEGSQALPTELERSAGALHLETGQPIEMGLSSTNCPVQTATHCPPSAHNRR